MNSDDPVAMDHQAIIKTPSADGHPKGIGDERSRLGGLDRPTDDAVNAAAAVTEDENSPSKGVTRRSYQSLCNDTLVSLLCSVGAALGHIAVDTVGKANE